MNVIDEDKANHNSEQEENYTRSSRFFFTLKICMHLYSCLDQCFVEMHCQFCVCVCVSVLCRDPCNT